jgi:hypothetical protein
MPGRPVLRRSRPPFTPRDPPKKPAPPAYQFISWSPSWLPWHELVGHAPTLGSAQHLPQQAPLPLAPQAVMVFQVQPREV